MDFMQFLEWTLYGNSVRQWLLAGLTVLGVFTILMLARRILFKRMARLAGKTGTGVDDVAADLLNRTHFLFVFVVSIYGGTLFLHLSPLLQTIINGATIIALFLQIGIWADRLLVVWVKRQKGEELGEDPARNTTMNILKFVGRLILWSVVVLLVLDNVGVEVTALIAGLGIGGIAIGLAAQSILGDLFASLSILFDKPFEVGDFIIVGEYLGTVERIGIKTTRVRSLTGEQLIFSNDDLVQSRIQNYKLMAERRVSFGIGVTYETPYQKLNAIPEMIREIIENQEQTRFDRAHFKAYGASSLDFEIVYYVLSGDYNLYMDIQQAINLAIFRRFEENKIEFAYPTRTLHLNGQVKNIRPEPDKAREYLQNNGG